MKDVCKAATFRVCKKARSFIPHQILFLKKNSVKYVNKERYDDAEVYNMAKPFKLQLIETFATLMTAAFGMIAALAWNTAIKALIDEVFGTAGDALLPLFVYAIVITVIAVICIIMIARSLGKLKESYEAEEAAKK
jgi:uncharacterized membrane protein YcjF (UPF0283 family)